MRLVCPNCAAKYEVADDAIPATGRDVQCANCGQTWFQEPPARADDKGSRITGILRGEAEREKKLRRQEEEQQARDAAEQEAAPVQEADAEDPGASPPGPDDADDAPEADPPEAPRADAETHETQAPADPPTPPGGGDGADALSDAPARETADEPADEPAVAPAPTRPVRPSRPTAPGRTERPRPGALPGVQPGPERAGHGFREITPDPPADAGAELPDVDQITATLESPEDYDREQAPPPAPTRRRGNRLGFYLAILIFLLLLAAYALKPQLIAALPESEPYLDRYSDLVDAGRVKLAAAAAQLIEAVGNLLSP